MGPQDRLDFVTLGMFIIDEIHWPESQRSEIDILGGAGSFSILGARLLRQPPASRRISWIVHAGSDFPESLRRQIGAWDTACNIIETPDRLTTRGWNSYGEDEARAFKYTTPKLRVDQNHLSDEQLLAKCFHLISSPTRCVDLVKGISERRQNLLASGGTGLHTGDIPPPLFVWEPVPDCCTPDELDNTLGAMQFVDVVSPNHQELSAFFGESTKLTDQEEDIAAIRRQCEYITKAWQNRPGTVIVRCGEGGCLWMESNGSFKISKPYHRNNGARLGLGEPCEVQDPTGGGNAFLGGLCAGLVDETIDPTRRLDNAVTCGLVAASFVIEQVGMPVRAVRHGEEEWNGDSVTRRIRALDKATKGLS